MSAGKGCCAEDLNTCQPPPLLRHSSTPSGIVRRSTQEKETQRRHKSKGKVQEERETSREKIRVTFQNQSFPPKGKQRARGAKGTGHKAWRPEFKPRSPQGGGRTNPPKFSSGLHMCITACVLRNLTKPGELAVPVTQPALEAEAGGAWAPGSQGSRVRQTQQANKATHKAPLVLSTYSGVAGF